MNKQLITRIIIAVLLVIVCLLSHFKLADYCSNPDHFEKTIKTLTDKQEDVLILTGTSTTLSIVVSCLPGDTATPIADKLADMGTIFLIILCAIFMEKYMVTIAGYLVFKWLVPFALLVIAVNLFINVKALYKIAFKLIAFGLVLFLIVPFSVQISNMIEQTYQKSQEDSYASIYRNSLNNAEALKDEINGEDEEEDADSASDADSESGNLVVVLQRAVENLKKKVDYVIDTVKDASEKLKDGVYLDEAKEAMNSLVETTAIMLVTSCVIPILVLFVLIWVVKLLFNVDIQIPDYKKANLVKQIKKDDKSEEV